VKTKDQIAYENLAAIHKRVCAERDELVCAINRIHAQLLKEPPENGAALRIARDTDHRIRHLTLGT
jgi:hypothetical protein